MTLSREEILEIQSWSEEKVQRELEQAMGTLEGHELLRAMQRLAHSWRLASTVGDWGHSLYRRDPTVFGPFLSGLLARAEWALDERAEPWLREAEARGDVAIARVLVRPVLLFGHAWRDRRMQWQELLRSRFVEAETPTERSRVLSIYGVQERWIPNDPVATSLYQRDREVFLPWFFEFMKDMGDEWYHALRFGDRDPYPELLEAMRNAGDPRLMEMYRWTVGREEWAQDVGRICGEFAGERLYEELREHHPERVNRVNPQDVYRVVAQVGTRETRRYLAEALAEDDPFAYGGWEELAGDFEKLGWWECWGKVVKTRFNVNEFNRAVEARLGDEGRERGSRLLRIGGGRTGGGVHRLSPDVARRLYEAEPEVTKAAFRAGFQVYHHGDLPPEELYSETAKAALQRGDREFFDFLASRLFGTHFRWLYRSDPQCDPKGFYVRYYEALPRPELARRGARVLSLVDFEDVDWRGHKKRNALTELLLGDPRLYLNALDVVEDLLESVQPRVKSLGFEVLAAAAEKPGGDQKEFLMQQLHHLLAAPLMELPGRGHRAAFTVMVRIAADYPPMAPVIHGRLREVGRLQYAGFTRGELVWALASLLKARPELRQAGEEPVIYGAERAEGQVW